jgi:S1-C subfamily serine protease
MKWVLSLSAALLACMPPLSAADEFEKTLDRVALTIVKIRTYEMPEGFIGCTGWVVSASWGEVITASHCLPEVDPEQSRDEDAPIVFVDEAPSVVKKVGGDLVLLSVRPMTKPPLDLRKVAPAVGDTVVAVGYPRGGVLTALFRQIASLKYGYMGEVFDGYFVVNGWFDNGMSGGPIVDLDGKVVGVIQGGAPVGGVGTDWQTLKDFVRHRQP